MEEDAPYSSSGVACHTRREWVRCLASLRSLFGVRHRIVNTWSWRSPFWCQAPNR